MGEDATHYNRTLGARNAVTQWPAVSWGVGTTIKIFIDEVLTREDDSFRGGRITLKRMKVFVKRSDGVVYRDRIDYPAAAPVSFLVESVTTVEYLYGNAQYDRVILVRFTD
jgi:hypothetical protein